MVEDAPSSSVVYGSGWAAGSNSCESTFHYASASGATVHFTTPVGATAVRWMTALASNLGIAQISVDGGPATTVDTYSRTLSCSGTWMPNPLPSSFINLDPSRSHTVILKVLGTRNSASSGNTIVVDGFQYLQ
jgi:hypothetical protein